MNLYKMISVALLVALVSFESEGFWGRKRRRRRCIPAVECNRFVSRLPKCNDGFCPHLSESRGCNLNCANGGTLLEGVCICRHSYTGICCETYDPPYWKNDAEPRRLPPPPTRKHHPLPSNYDPPRGKYRIVEKRIPALNYGNPDDLKCMNGGVMHREKCVCLPFYYGVSCQNYRGPECRLTGDCV